MMSTVENKFLVVVNKKITISYFPDKAPLFIGIALFIVAIAIKPIRKAIGLLLVILGILACLSGIGLIIGIPAVLVGGILLFS